MPQNEGVRELYSRASTGDTGAMLKWLRAQRTGRYTRFYPAGCRGEHEGAIAFALSVHGEGENRRWALSAGKKVRSIEIEPEKAQAVTEAILDQVGPTLIHAYPIEAVFFDGCVWVKSPLKLPQTPSWTPHRRGHRRWILSPPRRRQRSSRS